MTTIPCQRKSFDLPDNVTYLNCGYMSPLTKAVSRAGRDAVDLKAQPWRITAPDFFENTERVRSLFGTLIGSDAEGVALLPSCSYGTASAARNLPVQAGQRIVTLAEQFPSNVYAWRELAAVRGGTVVRVGRDDDGRFDAGLIEAIDDRTAIVALPNCHWTDGTLIDLEAVGQRCRDVGAALVVDLAQSCGAMPFDVKTVQPDFVVSVGYKWLMGPYGTALMYVAPKWREGVPLEHGWMARRGSEDFSGLVTYEDRFQPGARRFDMGQVANFHLMPMVVAALEQLADWGVDNIAESVSALTASITSRALAMGLEAGDPSHRAGHYAGIRFPDGVPDGLLQRLADEQVYVSRRGDTLRITPHLYNSETDIDRLFDLLART